MHNYFGEDVNVKLDVSGVSNIQLWNQHYLQKGTQRASNIRVNHIKHYLTASKGGTMM